MEEKSNAPQKSGARSGVIACSGCFAVNAVIAMKVDTVHCVFLNGRPLSISEYTFVSGVLQVETEIPENSSVQLKII